MRDEQPRDPGGRNAMIDSNSSGPECTKEGSGEDACFCVSDERLDSRGGLTHLLRRVSLRRLGDEFLVARWCVGLLR